MKIFNSFTTREEEFKPLVKGEISMYLCGPTVYDVGHLGHGRSQLSFDVIRRYFLYKGFAVKYVCNFTDIDDKMIDRAAKRGISVSELAEEIIPEYHKDFDALGIMRPDVQPRATEYIAEVLEIIRDLESKSIAYILEDGVYFDVTKFPDYGKLSKQKLDELQKGVRNKLADKKRNPQDFVLWKFAKPGEPFWQSRWGDGRPGWHIECSAMTRAILGVTFDIHAGGADLIFPHHECEVAQSEASSGVKFVNYWMHNGFLNINNEKMSKSLGNFFTMKDIFEKFDPQVIRFLFLQSHYRAPIEFSEDALIQAKNGLQRLHDFYRRFVDFETVEGDVSEVMRDLAETTKKDFEVAMENDFETNNALTAWFNCLKELNRHIDLKLFTSAEKKLFVDLIERLDSVFGVLKPRIEAETDLRVDGLIIERNQARTDKNWTRADEIRQQLKAEGIELEDSLKGTIWKKI